jgi:hypothetical protein
LQVSGSNADLAIGFSNAAAGAKSWQILNEATGGVNAAGSLCFYNLTNSTTVVCFPSTGGLTTTGSISQTTANGATRTWGSNSEEITLATGATTTDSVANLLPANSVIDSVVARVTQTITAACTGWEVGTSGSPTRFSPTGGFDATLTVGETTVDVTNAQQTVADKIRVTCNTGNPGAGKVRVTVFYSSFTAPTS